MEGTVYVTPDSGSMYCFNPIYQSSDGRVYTMTGNFLSSSGNQGEGEVFSQTMSATYSKRENGMNKTDSISIKLSISVMYPPEKIVVLQMGKGSYIEFRICSR